VIENRRAKWRQGMPPFCWIHGEPVCPGVPFRQQKMRLILIPEDVLFELGYFKSQGNALPVLHAGIGILQFQKVLEFVLVFFEIYHPDFFLLVIIDGYVDATLADIRVNLHNFPADFIFVMHEDTSFAFVSSGRQKLRFSRSAA
jgi:hypothetical protein